MSKKLSKNWISLRRDLEVGDIIVVPIIKIEAVYEKSYILNTKRTVVVVAGKEYYSDKTIEDTLDEIGAYSENYHECSNKIGDECICAASPWEPFTEETYNRLKFSYEDEHCVIADFGGKDWWGIAHKADDHGWWINGMWHNIEKPKRIAGINLLKD